MIFYKQINHSVILKQSILEMIFGTVQLFCRTVYIHCCYNIPEYQLHPSLNQILNINSNFFSGSEILRDLWR